MADHSPHTHTTATSYLAKLDGGCSEAQLSSTPNLKNLRHHLQVLQRRDQKIPAAQPA
jgi:hypothetical protein